MKSKRYVEIVADGSRGYIVRFMVRGKGLMHAIYCEAINHNFVITSWIESGKI